MDKTVAGLIGAVAALSATPSHAAAPAPQSIETAMQASTYADLLKPIPNALGLLKNSSAAEPAAEGEANIRKVQLVVVQHHHHHHHRHYRRRHYHHHHHHHHSQD